MHRLNTSPASDGVGVFCCCVLAGLLGMHAAFAASTALGTTNALRCFEESRFPLSEQGIEFCDAAINFENLSRRDLAATYSNRGIIYLRNGKYEQALKDHNTAIMIKPDLAQIYVNRGNVYYHMLDYGKAIADFDKALETGGGPVALMHHNKALTLLKLKKFKEARVELELALEADPDSVSTRKKLQQVVSMIEGD